MNKKYIVDQEGIVTVITDTGETIERKDKYTQNTDTILSLESTSELVENKIELFEQRLNELNNEIRTKNKIIRFLNIVLIVLTFILLVLSTSISINLSLSLLLGSIPLTIVIGVIENIIINKDKEKREYYNRRIKEGKSRINKIQKRIDELSKDKNTIKSNNTYTEIIPISEYYHLDAVDYFVENYLITVRAKEMSKSKKRIKQKPKQKGNIEYIF